MAINQTEQLLKDVKALDLQHPIVTIARETGFSKAYVSELLSGKKSASANFMKVFRSKFFTERNILEDESLLKEDDAVYGRKPLKISNVNLNSVLDVLRKQADTILSQQETIKILAMKINPIMAQSMG